MSSKFTKGGKSDQQRSRDVYRAVNRGAALRDEIDKIQERQDQFERDSAEIDKLFKVIERHPEGSPEYEAAMKRVEYLTGGGRGAYPETATGLKIFFRTIGREVIAFLMLQLRFLFIVLINVVFFGIAIWVLYAWAIS